MTHEQDDTSYEPTHAASPTAHILGELQLYGYHPGQDEPDTRPLPEAPLIAGAVADIFDAFVATLSDTRLEPCVFRWMCAVSPATWTPIPVLTSTGIMATRAT